LQPTYIRIIVTTLLTVIYLSFFSGAIFRSLQISKRKICSRHFYSREAGIEAIKTMEIMSILVARRQSPLGLTSRR
jgi:hypothetical protein